MLFRSVVTDTFTVPVAVVAGETAVICVGESTVTLAAVRLPNLTTAPVMKPVPVMTTDVPPELGPVFGDSAEVAPEVTTGVTAV